MFTKVGSFQVLRLGSWACAGLGLLLSGYVCADTVEVDVRSNLFAPQTVNIKVGDTVRWTAVDPGHTVTSGSSCGTSDGGFDSGGSTLPVGTSFSHTFTQTGSFPYHCRPHCSIGMTGVVNVAGGTSTAPNKPPKLKLTPSNNSPNKKSRMIDEGETQTVKVVASDPDRDVVTLDATGLPPGALWTPGSGKLATGQFSWTPGPGTAATQPTVTVVFSATDSPRNGASPLTRTEAFTLTVGQNSPPVLDNVQAPPAAVGKRLKLKITASDRDGDQLKFLPTAGLPEGARFKASRSKRGSISGTLTWKPRADQVDQEFRVTFTVQDNFVNPAQGSTEVLLKAVP